MSALKLWQDSLGKLWALAAFNQSNQQTREQKQTTMDKQQAALVAAMTGEALAEVPKLDMAAELLDLTVRFAKLAKVNFFRQALSTKDKNPISVLGVEEQGTTGHGETYKARYRIKPKQGESFLVEMVFAIPPSKQLTDIEDSRFDFLQSIKIGSQLLNGQYEMALLFDPSLESPRLSYFAQAASAFLQASGTK
ncbi:MAG: hypothetical protein OXU45_03760 [Candidatus Melainabacteria bacterium]|nr:hypothetical protein [Candidatus Melainabacteria bacterium]